MPTTPTGSTVYRNIPNGYALAVSLAKNLRRLRRAADIRQEDLGQMLGVGQAAVSRWELGKTQPDATMLPKIAAAVRASLDQLLQGEAAEYDASRDLLGHGTPVQPSATHSQVAERDADVPASARERIAQLQQEVADYKARLKETEGMAARLVHIAAGSKSRKATGTTPGPRRRR